MDDNKAFCTCGEELDVVSVITLALEVRITVKPCPVCMGNEYENGRDDGNGEGHDEGYDEGYADGVIAGQESTS